MHSPLLLAFIAGFTCALIWIRLAEKAHLHEVADVFLDMFTAWYYGRRERREEQPQAVVVVETAASSAGAAGTLQGVGAPTQTA